MAKRRNSSVRIRLKEQTKSRWEQEANSQGRNLSEFIRFCVLKEINGFSSETQDFSELHQRLDKLENSLGSDDVEHRLAVIESMLKPTRDIASQVYELLPNSIPDRDGAMFDEHSHTEASGNPEYIARHIDGNVEDVRTALKELQNELHNVHSINGVYYRS